MNWTESAEAFLEKLVRIPGNSFEESARADFIQEYLEGRGLKVERLGENIIVRDPMADASRPTLMLNSHIDTVKPSESYTFNPYDPPVAEDRIYGLGSNDAGGSVTCLLHAFLHFIESGSRRNVNLTLVLSCEEERSGAGGMSLVCGTYPDIADMAVIGEPTSLQAAVAERGLLVVDATAHGVSGHAAREEGVNAIYKAMEDIAKIERMTLPKVSPTMGRVKMTVTQVEAGYVHNIVPDTCRFVIDIRPTDCYTNPQIMEMLSGELLSELKARNLTNRSSSTPDGCPLLDAVKRAGIPTFVSQTTSDWMRIGAIPAVKIGPGESSRSHKADEFILKEEISKGMETYISIIESLQ